MMNIKQVLLQHFMNFLIKKLLVEQSTRNLKSNKDLSQNQNQNLNQNLSLIKIKQKNYTNQLLENLKIRNCTHLL